MKTLYRVEDYHREQGYMDFDGETWLGSGDYMTTLVLTEFPVQRETPKGYWIDDKSYEPRKTPNGWRFVLKNGRKKFACSTKTEAYESLLARKQAQIKILSTNLKCAEQAKARAEHWMEENE